VAIGRNYRPLTQAARRGREGDGALRRVGEYAELWVAVSGCSSTPPLASVARLVSTHFLQRLA
jgi:hypothetical protein